ncbi:helix-turn-helix transcriptional regulator [Rhodococcus sp. ACS1]|uniref:helix-turn-helix transcriptional regulator n=1 Tax=Rhodococcus sp. ACS1 TaxID=2028570 RepID=UPI000BB1267B|nr:LuxR family transcriptional regulator [Rhodococcus sp. ACS1]PBC35512.1 helix-turn-helix transcriptional regulator [Rhodococcus sp. ACS1]
MASVWPLVGRAEELRLINAAVTGADDYGGVVIAGPPGVGKSRLAHEAITHINPGRWVSRWARATTSVRALPLGAFAEWAGDLAEGPLLVVRGVIDHLVTTPEGAKVVVGVDDAHLLDDLSSFVVHQLVHRKLAKIVVTIRTGEPTPDAVTALWKDGHLQRVELQPLSESETVDLLTTVLGGRIEHASTQKLWTYTRGNVLYLRHLLEQELASNRLTEHQGIWEWTGQPVVSPGLADLIDTQIGALPDMVGAVLDLLAVGEPLPEQMLADLTDPDSVETAHAAGLITVADSDQHPVRLAHPLYGEARRAKATPLRLRRLRSRLATTLASRPDAGPRDLVRRAVLTLESDLRNDPALFTAAATASLSLFDAGLAEKLAAAAITSGAGYDAQLTHSTALALASRGREADDVAAQILTMDLTHEQIAEVACHRLGHLLWILGRPELADSILLDARKSTPSPVHASLTAGHAIIRAYEGRPIEATEAARSALQSAHLADTGAVWALGALLLALGDLGKADQIPPIANRAYDLLDHSARVSALRLIFSEFHTGALRLAGNVHEADTTTARVCREAADIPGWVQPMSCMLMGRAALAAGRLTETRNWLEPRFGSFPRLTGYIPRVWCCALAQAQAVSGDHAAAAETLRTLDALHGSAVPFLEPEHLITRAWVAAASGAVTRAIELANQGAKQAGAHHQYTQEVVCLHTATRFGDSTTADRLQELAGQVDGPRAPAAAQHATALAAGDAVGLLDASHQFEDMGDLLAAIDAAAHAATTHRHHGRNGSALTAAARAQRLADTCGGADTPALREARQPSPLTARQREVITLVAQGLSNKQIAEKLTLSVRTVEGHLHRASVKTGVSGRNDLGATVTGR